MFFSIDNPWAWVALALALLTLAADILGAVAKGVVARVIAFVGLALHLLLLASLFVGGAELTLAVTAMMVSLLVYTSARYFEIEYKKRRGEGER